MYILFFLLWVLFNGNLTLEITIFGLVISAIVYAFFCKFMDFSIKRDIELMKKLPYLIHFFIVLVWEIIKANIAMAKYIVIKQEYELRPTIFKMKTKLKTRFCKVLLANAITLTPGTITISIIGDELIIHAVDESTIIENDPNFVFERLLVRLENAGKSKKVAVNNAEADTENVKAIDSEEKSKEEQ